MAETRQNWAGNYTYRAARWHYPETVAEVQALVARCDKLRVVGTRHSFNDIADSPGDILSLARFRRSLTLDRERHTVTVDGGTRYGDLCEPLHRAGYALPNLASLPHISVAGACATATHGSGERLGTLATAVCALELVTADGAVVELSREQHRDEFEGAVVGLGGPGVVTRLTLDLAPTFEVQQVVYENLALQQLDEHFDEIMSSGYSVSLFTDWRAASFNQVWLKQRVEGGAPRPVPAALFGAPAAPDHRHPIPGLAADPCTPQRGIPGPWHERLPHFRLDFTPSSGAELQSEYLVPRPHARAALRAIARLRDQVAPLLQVSEVRVIAADRLWLSPCYQQPCVGIHFTWRPDWPAVQALLPQVEEALAPFEARPHWGKLFTMAPARLQRLYPKLPDFQQLLARYDPQGKFRNGFLDRYLFGTT